tara:strand:+ start:2321 stop:3181 length:861 start_codon:yes stop_codon:yes gene_type:complete
MAKEKEKVVNVTVGEGEEKRELSFMVKKPNNFVQNKANALFTKWLHEFIRDGIMTKKELENYMEEKEIWTKAKEKEQQDLAVRIRELTKDLYQGKRGKRKAEEGKQIAVDIKMARLELQNLIAEKMSLEQNTAESLADNMKFDYLVSECTYDAKGKEKVYKTLDEYNEGADDELAFAAAATLAQLLYSIDRDYEEELPENKFLKMFDYVDEDLNLIDEEGGLVSFDGKKINKLGQYVNAKGERVDVEGNLLDEDGQYVLATQYTKERKSQSKSKSKPKTEDNVESV